MKNRQWLVELSAACLLCSAVALPASAQTEDQRENQREDQRSEGQEAQKQVENATRIVQQMSRDPGLRDMLQQARGVFIVPNFGQGAAIVGGRGGEGVLLVRRDNEWNGPAFFDFGRISVGAQAGGAGGSVAMLLMTDKAVQAFSADRNNFSLDASAGLTIVDYETQAKAATRPRDIVVWSDTKGLFAGASIGLTDVRRDQDDNRAYYMKPATPQEIFSGTVSNPHAQALRDALPDRMAASD